MNELILEILQKKTNDAIEKAFGDRTISAEVAPCVQEEFGHYQCNNALSLAKELKKNPREVAAKIIENFEKEGLAKIEIAGPGFINLTLDPKFLSSKVQDIFEDPLLGAKKVEKPQKIIVEFSSPNIAKELHVGHLRSTIIGDCLARLFEFLKHDVLRLNHIGDWGTQFGMLITYLKEKEPDILSGKKHADLSTLTQWYKEAKKKFDEDEAFKKRSQEQVVKLQGGEKEALYAWNIICDISREAFQEIYKLLDIKITERGESFYNPELPIIIQELENKGLIQISDGAKCIFSEEYKNREGNPLPVMVQKSDGGFTYDTTDIAGFRQRINVEKADRIIIVTDAGQSLHFKIVYEVVVKAGYLNPEKQRFDHVGFGVVLGPDGKKFKTREGETEKLIDLLKKAIEYAKKILKERLTDIKEYELNEFAEALGISAVKYADLSCHRIKDYVFSYDRMLKLEGNTAAFLFYSYVRILSIKRKVHVSIDDIKNKTKISLKHPSELSLGLHICRFGEVLEMMSRDLLPNRLTDYLYILAEKFNAFFRDCKVIGSDEQNERLLLCEITADVLKKGFDILGLKPLPRM